MELILLKSILIIFVLSILVLFICNHLHIPSIVGYLFTGLLAGPHGLRLVNEIHQVEILAELGIILLLFTIGMEFSFEKLLQLKKPALLGGTFQVLVTITIIYLISTFFSDNPGEAIFIGFLVSLSSTAIVMKLLEQKAQIDSPHGRSIIGILIFQDIIIVPMMLLTPLLAGIPGQNFNIYLLLAKIAIIIIVVITGTKWIVPFILYKVAQTKSREIFLLSIIAIGLLVAWLTSSAGLSLALGAFLAGLIISESEFSHQALGNILPFRDVFISFFFVSVGMLLDIKYFLQEPLLVISMVLVVFVIKSIIAVISGLIIGLPIRSAILIGLALFQVGEFSFILAKTGQTYGLLSENNYQLFLTVSIITMAITPFLLNIAPKFAYSLAQLRLFKNSKLNFNIEQEQLDKNISDHLIIVGFGLNGRNVAKAADFSHIQYNIIETNVDTVKEEKKNNKLISFGDATQPEVLTHANIKNARVIVIAISDPVATRRIIELAKRLNEQIYIIVRTRFLKELDALIALGADEVIPEEFETSVEIFTRVLYKYLIPKEEIEHFISELRSDNYMMFRNIDKKTYTMDDYKFTIPDMQIFSIKIQPGSFATNKTIREIELRNKFGITALAIYRDSQYFPHPQGDDSLQSSDIIIVIGKIEDINNAKSIFSSVDSRKDPAS